ncbi:ARMT1-like domain-containing protein [Thermodesulfobacteriota bacterium]
MERHEVWDQDKPRHKEEFRPLQQAGDVSSLHLVGEDPVRDAWYTAFFIENHLDPYSYPEHVALPEQVQFMVSTEENERYYPCSDKMFKAIMDRMRPPFLEERYDEILAKILQLIDEQIENTYEKTFLKALTKTKFIHETRDGVMIPSRIEKRLYGLFLDRTQIEDPYLCEKARRNQLAFTALSSEAFRKAFDRIDHDLFTLAPESLEEVKSRVDRVKIRRLFALSAERTLWQSDGPVELSEADYGRISSRAFTGEGLRHLDRLLLPSFPIKILWLANESGEIVADLAIVNYLARLGHKVIVAFKDGPLFTKVDFYDAQEDESLQEYLDGALFIEEKGLGKNELVTLLKSDKNIMAISDGTREILNLLLVTTTFARIFREVDLVVSRGQEQRRRLFRTHFHFTQDILNIATEPDGSVSVLFKPRHPAVIKFSHRDLEKKARNIIFQMEQAKKQDMTVMFYSGIIGSIPGKIEIAKKVMETFIRFLRDQSANTFIINPSEHYEPGMDADDLMYMWEIVQRSGFIDIWRFQSYDDIVKAFGIMETKVPPEWVGKDATFSTGCTKEMKIALDVQRDYPEMQIIGPAREKFIRRSEYGVGKMYDRRLDMVCSR